MLLDTVLTYPRPSSLDIAKIVKPEDPLVVQWAKKVSDERKNFYFVADQSFRSLCPLRDPYKQAYKDFHQYLTTTIEMLDFLPTNAQHRVHFEYSSGITNQDLNTSHIGMLVSRRCQRRLHCGDGFGQMDIHRRHLQQHSARLLQTRLYNRLRHAARVHQCVSERP